MSRAAASVGRWFIARSDVRGSEAWFAGIAALSAASPTCRSGLMRAIAHRPVGKSPIADRFRRAREDSRAARHHRLDHERSR
jgi:hypothetical protein